MRNSLFAIVALSLLVSCSSPVLKWIDTPGGTSGRISGQTADKEILSFTFGIEGETDLPIGKIPDSTGKIPILIILPLGTDAGSLSPTIAYVGKSLSPASGEAGDFRSPVVYTVVAEDDSSRDYIVRVYARNEASKAIVRFALDVSGNGDLALIAQGIIDEDTGAITVSVPAGLDIRNVNAHVAHTGVNVIGPLGNPHLDASFSFAGDFSAPTLWTVIAQDQTAKIYTVTVVREKSHDKEITRFSFGIVGEDVIIGGEPQPDGKYPILAIVPDPIVPPPIVDLRNTAPFVSYTGMSISPGPDILLNFSRPNIYTVTAEDRSAREYMVTVIRKDNAQDSLKQITGFYLTEPLAEGIIDEATHTIAIAVPQGTNVGALRPEIYYIGASISPGPGQPKNFSVPVQYTVRAQDGTTQPYTVSVTTFASPVMPKIDVSGAGGEKVDVGSGTAAADADGNLIIFVELPTYILNPTININYQKDSGETETRSETITNNNVYNNIAIMEDNNEYNLVVINPPPDAPSPPPPPSSAASIDGFYFASPAAIGAIGTGAGTPADPIPIAVTVPYGTDPRNLAATICYTGKEIAGVPGPNPLKDGARSFANPVDYTVIAENGTSSRTYRATVTVAPNNAKEISNFSFSEVVPVSAMISAMPNALGKYPIVVTVPQGQPVASLTPIITHTGASIGGAGIDAGGPGTVTASSAVTSFDPVTPVDYRVTAENGSTKTYAVTVRNAQPQDDSIEITGFYFTDPLAVGAIDQNANTITVAVTSATNTSSLKPKVYFKGMSLKPGSGAAQNFSGPVTYTVAGNSGKTRSYTVTVVSTPSSAKDITRFAFPGINNSETIIGAAPDPDGGYPISVWVPAGTDLSNAGPDIVHTGVSITPAAGTSLDFDVPQTYTVTAEDGSTKTYKIIVNPQSGDAKAITSLVFEEIPLAGGGVVRVVASIDQGAHVINAEVPFAADISALKPTLTYIGKSIAGPSGIGTTANPFTDTPRDFSGSQTYAVKDQLGAEQGYVVRVTRKSSVGVSFAGDAESAIIGSSAFDQSSAVVTVALDPGSGVSPPYEWYLDGVKQPVSTTQDSFTLNVGDGTLIPGRHEIMVSGRKNGLHYTGKVYFTVSGGTK
jgi:hypothetical protein